MNHFYSNLKLMLVALFAFVGINAWADDAYYTLDTSSEDVKTSNNAYANSADATVGDITWTFQGNGTIHPWRLGGKNLSEVDRVAYTKTSMDRAITSIDLTVGTASSITVNSLKLVVASDAEFKSVLDEVTKEFVASSTITFTPTSGDSWAKDAYYKFVFNVTVGKDNKFVQFSKVEFFAVAEEGPTVARPSITPNGGTFIGRQEVTIACETEGAVIYYTTNGDDPVPGSSNRYAGVFRVTETTTIKAIAVKDEVLSSVASATFTEIPSYSTFASMSALENNALFAYTGDARIIAKPTAKYVYVMDSPFDNPTYALIYDASGEKTATAEVGKMIPGGWTGKVSIYNKLFELVPDNAIVVSDEPAQPINYPAIALGTAKMNQVFTLKGVTSYSANGKNISIYVNGEDKDISEAQGVYGYNQFAIEIPAFEEGKTYEIVGAIGQYNDKVQFWPISIQEESEPGPEPELGFYVAGSMTEWGIVAANKMTMDEELEKTKHIKEFSLTLPLKANDGVKVASSYGVDPITWFPTGSGNEYVVEADGDYTVYCRPNFDGDETWIEKCLKVVRTVVPVATQNAGFEEDAESNAIGVRTYAKDVKGEETSQMQAVTGWTIVENGDARAAGVFAYGSKSFLGGEGYMAPAAEYAFEEGATKALGLVGVWSANLQYTQEVNLEPGKYLLQVPVYNAGGANAVSANKIGADGTFADTKEFPVDQWTVLNVEFTVESAKDVTLSLGYAAANSGSAAMPHLFIESAKLYSGEEAISLAKAMAEARCKALNAVIALEKAKADMLATLDALVPGEGLFQYDAQAINLAKEAVVLAETVEAVEAAMPTPTLPDPEKQYTFQQKASGLYMSLNDGVKLAAKAYPMSWVATEGGWYIKNEDLYVGLAGSNNWDMSTASDKKLVITPAAVTADGAVYYTLSEEKGMIASDGTEAGSACYADKSVAKSGDKAYWTIAEYVAPTYVVTISDAIENGTIEATPTTAQAGATVSLSATPAEGYVLASIMVTCKTIDKVVIVSEDHVFTMPDDDVTVTATFAPAPTVWEAYPGWTRDNMASARYFGIKTPGTAADAYAISAFQIAQESGYGASTSYAVIATDVPEGTALDASKVIAVSTDAVTPDVAAPGKFFDYALTEEVVLKGATVYYVAFTTSNEPVDGSFTVQGQRVSLNVSYGTYPYPYVDGGGTARTTWTPGFKAELALPTFAINCAEVENGKVETNVAEAKVGDKVIVTATPAEGYKLKAIIVTGKTSDIAVEVAEDGSFIMPADDVTVSATFKDLASVVYIETDLTAQFPIDWNGWTGATGYVGWAAPEVTTNDGRKTPACERYESTCANTGVVFSRQLTGLANGLYTIELYGAAAFTSGRGFDSELTEGDETAVYLYAQTPAGEVKQYIPAHVATDFNGTGIATATLVNVEVTDGTINIGMSKDKPYTNWHVVQIKGVTATVDAASLLAHSVKEAREIDSATIPAALATEIGDVIVANDKEYETADEYKAAIVAIDAVVAKAVAYAPLTAVLAQGEIYKAHVAAGDAAIATYEEAIADVAAAYATVSVADIPAAIAIVEAALPALAKAQTADGSDMTLAIVNPEINGADGWTCEKPLGGNGPLLNNTAFEYWAGNASNRAEASFDYYQVIEGLPNGLYTVSADMYNSTNGEDGAVFAPTSGVYASADNEEATLVDVDGTDWITYATDVVLVSDGKLRIGVKSTEKPMAARWFAADNFKLTLVKALSETELAYEKAIASIEDSASYRIFTTVNEKKFYLNSTGYLVADANKAASFTFAEVNASGTLYETGINLGCKFTNPKLTSGATGDVVKQGHIIVGTNDRNDWERQVFFLKDGKYAVRATNANSANWGANTYWTVDNIEAELPNAEYALDPAYVWEIEKYVDNRPSAYAIAQTWPAKLQAIEGLVTDAANWTTNAQEGSEGAIKNICDGDVKTFFHSQWSGTGPDADHYIQATLPEAAQKFHIAFYKRNDSNRPTSIVVSAGDAEPAQTITEGLPAPAWYSAEVDLGTAADVVRFTVPTTSTGGANNGHVYFTFGEFYILPSNELTDAACKYIVSDYTDIDPDFDPAEIERIDAQIEAAYQQIMLKEELADLAACIARGKEFIAAYPVEDAEQLAQEATGTLDRLAEGEYTTKEEVASAKANAILTVQLFIGATGTPTVDADITEWFVKSPTPIATQAVAEGWEGDKFGDASDGVSEYWNKAAATFHQTITLPAGDYKLTVVALQRTNMAGVVYAGDAQKTIAQATTDEANSRGQAAAWFNAGNGVNEVKFTMAEAGEIEIGLITDNTTGDHWTVWQSFKIEKLAPVPPVAFTVTPNIASGTQAEFTTVEAGTALKLTVSTENLEANGYNPEDITLKVSSFLASRWSDKGFAMGTNENPPYMKNDIVLPLADEVTLADDVFGTEYPFIQSILIRGISLMKGEEEIATLNEMIAIRFIEVYENGAPVGIKAIATEGEKAEIYDLSGRKVEKVQRGGIYIINGKKVSMK